MKISGRADEEVTIEYGGKGGEATEERWKVAGVEGAWRVSAGQGV